MSDAFLSFLVEQLRILGDRGVYESGHIGADLFSHLLAAAVSPEMGMDWSAVDPVSGRTALEAVLPVISEAQRLTSVRGRGDLQRFFEAAVAGVPEPRIREFLLTGVPSGPEYALPGQVRQSWDFKGRERAHAWWLDALSGDLRMMSALLDKVPMPSSDPVMRQHEEVTGSSLISKRVRQDAVASVKVLLDHGHSARDEDRQTGICLLPQARSAGMVALLLERGADPEFTGSRAVERFGPSGTSMRLMWADPQVVPEVLTRKVLDEMEALLPEVSLSSGSSLWERVSAFPKPSTLRSAHRKSPLDLTMGFPYALYPHGPFNAEEQAQVPVAKALSWIMVNEPGDRTARKRHGAEIGRWVASLVRPVDRSLASRLDAALLAWFRDPETLPQVDLVSVAEGVRGLSGDALAGAFRDPGILVPFFGSIMKQMGDLVSSAEDLPGSPVALRPTEKPPLELVAPAVELYWSCARAVFALRECIHPEPGDQAFNPGAVFDHWLGKRPVDFDKILARSAEVMVNRLPHARRPEAVDLLFGLAAEEFLPRESFMSWSGLWKLPSTQKPPDPDTSCLFESSSPFGSPPAPARIESLRLVLDRICGDLGEPPSFGPGSLHRMERLEKVRSSRSSTVPEDQRKRLNTQSDDLAFAWFVNRRVSLEVSARHVVVDAPALKGPDPGSGAAPSTLRPSGGSIRKVV